MASVSPEAKQTLPSEDVAAQAASELEALDLILPDDAPAGHECWAKVKFRPHAKSPFAEFRCKDVHFQATLGNCGSREATERVARACYLQFEAGATLDAVKAFRQDCYTRIKDFRKGASAKGKPQAVQLNKPTVAEPSHTAAANGKADTETATVVPGVTANATTAAPAQPEASANKAKVPIPVSAGVTASATTAAPAQPEASANKAKVTANATTAAPAQPEASANKAKAPAARGIPPGLEKEDVAEGDEAWYKCKWRAQKQTCFFVLKRPDGTEFRLQTTQKAAGGSVEEAMRIARVCFAKAREGMPPDEVQAYRNMMYEAAMAAAGPPGPGASAAQKRGGEDLGAARGADKRRRSADDSMSAAHIAKLLAEQGRLAGALRIEGRSEWKKNSSINGTYAAVAGGFGGCKAYEKVFINGGAPRFLFYSADKARWKIADSVGSRKGIAYLKAAAGGSSTPADVAPDHHWHVYDDKVSGHNADPDVRCSSLEQAVPNRMEDDSAASSDVGSMGTDHSSAIPQGKDGDESSDSDSSRSSSEAAQPGGQASSNAKPGASSQRGKRAQNIRACAKMMVRAGLRCGCHFAHLSACPGNG